MRSTHTYAEMEVSEATYNEIKEKLQEAGYDHAFMDDGALDMHGIGLKPYGELPENAFFIGAVFIINGAHHHHNSMKISYEEIRGVVYPEGGPKNPTCTWRYQHIDGGERSGTLLPGEILNREDTVVPFVINMIDTSNA